MTVTGAGQNLSNELGDLAGGNIYLLLAMSGLASFVLGMGMSSIACYLLTVTMLAPAIVGSGVEPMAVHMFLFYYGALSFITPPVAIAAFVASGISGGDPTRTGVLSLRMGMAGFLVPWAFVVYPAPDVHRTPVGNCSGVCFFLRRFAGHFRRSHGISAASSQNLGTSSSVCRWCGNIHPSA